MRPVRITLCLTIAAGGLVGALVLVLTSVGFTVATLAVAVANAFIVPYSALVIALFYEELAPAPGVTDLHWPA